MTGRTHDLAAFTAASFIVTSYTFNHLSLATVLVSLSAVMIGGIAPDIDQPTAKIWQSIPIGGHIAGKIIQPFLGGHRFISHSLIGLALFGFVGRYLLNTLHGVLLVDMNIVWWSFMIAFVSHLIMDTLTHEGVPWLFPIPIHFGIPPLKILRIKTGGVVEKSFIFPVLLIINAYLYYTHYHHILLFVKSFTK